MRACFVLICLLALSACSNDVEKKYFTTTGVLEPQDNFCPADPQSFGRAQKIPDFHEGNGCGITNAYSVTAVSNVEFSEPAKVNCSVANTFNSWIENTVQPRAQENLGERVVALKIAASYSCRPRDNVRGAKLSEHGLGNAIDVSGFTLASGKEITVLSDYYAGGQSSRFLKSIRAEACGPFHTVLGPGSDSYHNDHIHLDLQKERSGGPYCH